MKIKYSVKKFDPDIRTLKKGDYVRYHEHNVYKVSRYNQKLDMIYVEIEDEERPYGSTKGVVKINPAYLHNYNL